MTALQLAEWIMTLPPHLQKAQVESVVGSTPSTAKRVMAVEVGEHGTAIIVNSMGTHLSDLYSEHCRFVSTIDFDGRIHR
jgi:hypothetical protein